MEQVTTNPCMEHYSHRCGDCKHCKETKMYFEDSIFEVEERGYHCTKYDVYSSEKEMKRHPVYNSSNITGEMARKHIRFHYKCEHVKGEYRDLVIGGVTIHIQKDMEVRHTLDGIGVDGYLHAPVHSGGICYEDGQPYPSCPFMYNVGVSKIKVVDKTTLDMYLQDGCEFFNGDTCDRLELALGEVWINTTKEFETTRLINRFA